MDFTVVVEIPSEGNIKYEVDEKTGRLMVDRFLYTAMVYPFNYGYIEGAKGEDGDPLDAIVLSSHPVAPGSAVKCHPVGLLEMEDEEGIDTKIIAVPLPKVDPAFGSIEEVTAIPEVTKQKIKHFFEHYKELEPGKWVKLRDWRPRATAEEEVTKARQRNA